MPYWLILGFSDHSLGLPGFCVLKQRTEWGHAVTAEAELVKEQYPSEDEEGAKTATKVRSYVSIGGKVL